MEQSSTPLKVVLGALSIGVLGLLGFLILQAAKPTIKNPQPLSGTTTPKGEVTVGADVYGEADLKEVRLRLDGKSVQPVIVSDSQRHWTVSYKETLPRGPHEAELTVIDARGREQPYRWHFTAAGPGGGPRFANPLPRQGTRLAAGDALLTLAAFSDSETIKTLALELNGKPLATAERSSGPGQRTVASQRRALTPGDYTVRAKATDMTDETATYEWKFTVVDPTAGKGEPDARFFPETGYYAFAPFAAYWARNGGLALYGLPITPDFEQNGLTVQWFERARFERHPELPADQQVQLGLLGNELRQPDPRPATPPPSDRRFFPETGHSLGGRFRDYWDRNGGLAQFGLPLTEEVSENGLTVQWFERARFEYHPENPPDQQVQLTQLGRMLWQRGEQR